MDYEVRLTEQAEADFGDEFCSNASEQIERMKTPRAGGRSRRLTHNGCTRSRSGEEFPAHQRDREIQHVGVPVVEAKAAIAELLNPGESLADASTWADENRGRFPKTVVVEMTTGS